MRTIKKEELEKTLYYQTPKWLFDLLLEGKITPGAYSTYILMYERTRISVKNNWVDSEGHVYIKYSYEEMLSDLNIKSNTQVQRNLKKLESLGLIRKKKNYSSSTTYYIERYTPTQNVLDSITQDVSISSTQSVSLENTQTVSIIPTQIVETSNNNLNNNNSNNNNNNKSTVVSDDYKLTKEQIEFRNKLTLFKEKISFKIREKKFNITPEELLKYASGDIELVERQFKHFSDKGLRYLVASIKGKYEEPETYEDTSKNKSKFKPTEYSDDGNDELFEKYGL